MECVWGRSWLGMLTESFLQADPSESEAMYMATFLAEKMPLVE